MQHQRQQMRRASEQGLMRLDSGYQQVGTAIQAAPQGSASRSAKRTMVLRYTTDRFHSLMTSKFAVPSPNGAPARQPLVFRRLAVEANWSGRAAARRPRHRV